MANDQPISEEHVVPATAGSPREAEEPSKLLWKGSPMLRGEVANGIVWVLVGLVLIATPIVLTIMKWWTWLPGWAWAVFIGLGLILLLVPWIRMKAYSYEVTTDRITYEKGILSTTTGVVQFYQVRDLELNRGVLEKILGVGRIIVFAPDDPTTPQLTLHGIPNPRPLFAAMQQARERAQRSKGVVRHAG